MKTLILKRKKNVEAPASEEPVCQAAGGLTDYTVYLPPARELAVMRLLSILGGALVAYVFYRSLLLSLAAGLVALRLAVPVLIRQKVKKRQRVLLLQFKDMLDAMAGSLGAGRTVPLALSAAREDMLLQYGEEADIVRELDVILFSVQNNVDTLENLFADLARRSGLDDVDSFAGVFEACYRKGGNVSEIIRKTVTLVSEKISVEMEIDTAVTAQRTQTNAMLVMPIAMVLLITVMDPSGMGAAYSTPIGRAASTVGIILFAAAYFISRKILDIKV